MLELTFYCTFNEGSFQAFWRHLQDIFMACLLRSEESNLHMRKINVVYIMNLPTLVIRNLLQNDKGPLDLKGNRPTNF